MKKIITKLLVGALVVGWGYYQWKRIHEENQRRDFSLKESIEFGKTVLARREAGVDKLETMFGVRFGQVVPVNEKANMPDGSTLRNFTPQDKFEGAWEYAIRTAPRTDRIYKIAAYVLADTPPDAKRLLEQCKAAVELRYQGKMKDISGTEDGNEFAKKHIGGVAINAYKLFFMQDMSEIGLFLAQNENKYIVFLSGINWNEFQDYQRVIQDAESFRNRKNASAL